MDLNWLNLSLEQDCWEVLSKLADHKHSKSQVTCPLVPFPVQAGPSSREGNLSTGGPSVSLAGAHGCVFILKSWVN